MDIQGKHLILETKINEQKRHDVISRLNGEKKTFFLNPVINILRRITRYNNKYSAQLMNAIVSGTVN